MWLADMDSDSEEFRYYRPHWSSIDVDGTISMRVSVWQDSDHFSCVFTFATNDNEYPFWRWLIDHPDFQRVLSEAELNEARDRFALESGLA